MTGRAHHAAAIEALLAGRGAAAVSRLEVAVALEPASADYWNDMAVALADHPEESRRPLALRAALAVAPQHADALVNLGFYTHRRRELAVAACLYRRALAVMPTHAAAWSNLSPIDLVAGNRSGSATKAARATVLAPMHGAAWLNAAEAALTLGATARGGMLLRRGLALDPSSEAGQVALLRWSRMTERAADLARAARRLSALIGPDARSEIELAVANAASGRPSIAAMHARRAVALGPGIAAAHVCAGHAAREGGSPEKAVALLGRGLAIEPRDARAASDQLLCRQYVPGVTAAALASHHRTWALRFAVASPARPRRSVDPDRPIRVGYLSPDFALHPIGWFLAGVLPHHDPRAVEHVCYSDRLLADEMTQRLRAAGGAWVPCAGWTDSDLAARIEADRIDILIDLAGHTGANRLPLFARRAAPVQVTWAGYVGTTGVPAMDYLLADEVHVPLGEESAYSEKVIRLRGTYVCYTPPADAPPVSFRNARHVVFGCFNHLSKMNSEVVRRWAEILRRVPESRLVMHTRGLTDDRLRADLHGEFAAAGIEPTRIEPGGELPHQRLLARYGEVDIALDPFPYSGGLTTLEALWMGVPVVTIRGLSFAGRHSSSYLSAIGLGDLVTESEDAYVARAIELAQNGDRRRALRSSMRHRLLTSPVMDHVGTTRRLEAAFRMMWRDWCARA